MINRLKRLLFLGFLVPILGGAVTADAAEWTSFRLSGMMAKQAPDGTAEYGELSWSPSFELGSAYRLRTEMAASYVPDFFGGRFWIVDFRTSLAMRLGHIWFEAGPGLQKWFGDPKGTFVDLNANIVFPTHISFIREAIAGYSRVRSAGNGVNEYRIGIGASL